MNYVQNFYTPLNVTETHKLQIKFNTLRISIGRNTYFYNIFYIES
jgi:hypothetical protein